MRPHAPTLRALGVALAVVLAGCASTKPNLSNLSAEQWAHEVRARGVDPQEVPNPLLITEAMKKEAQRLAGTGEMEARLHHLQLALFDSTRFPFSYDVKTTLTAAESFHRREGNCLSFTNLFVALGRALGIPVNMALVLQARGSEREGDLIVVNNHVVGLFFYEAGTIYYDFDRTRRERPALLRPLDDLWITALYLNNRGADELRAGHPEVARRYFQNATKLAGEFAFAWGNLGVAQRRLGDTAGALAAYDEALKREGDNPTILTNLSALYRSLGREHEARLALEAANLSLASPHVLLVRGDLELSQGRVKDALHLFRRARRLAPKLADPWVAVARAELARARPDDARKCLEHALALEPGHIEARELLSSLDAATGHV